MKDDDVVRLIRRVFPGAELVGKYAQPSEVPQERRHRQSAPKAHVKPSEAVTADVGELCESVDAMVQWFSSNEPARLDRPGWQRIVKALAGVRSAKPVESVTPEPYPSGPLPRASKPAARAARDEAISSVEGNADSDWKDEALGAVHWCAMTYPEFTADEVWAHLEEGGKEETHEPAAIGPVFLRAARAGWIEKSGDLRPTVNARRHRDLTVWLSRLT